MCSLGVKRRGYNLVTDFIHGRTSTLLTNPPHRDLILPVDNREPHPPIPCVFHIVLQRLQRCPKHRPRLLMIIRIPRLQAQSVRYPIISISIRLPKRTGPPQFPRKNARSTTKAAFAHLRSPTPRGSTHVLIDRTSPPLQPSSRTPQPPQKNKQPQPPPPTALQQAATPSSQAKTPTGKLTPTYLPN